MIDQCHMDYRELIDKARDLLHTQNRVSSTVQEMTDRMSQLNSESAAYSTQYFEANVKD